MEDRIIIALSRQFGSGGHNIGKRLAKALDIPFYDEELIVEASRKSGITEGMVKAVEEGPAGSLLYAIAAGSPFATGTTNVVLPEMPMADKVFIAQSEVIHQYAKNGSCVIVGRCADHVLKNDPDLLSVFIGRDRDERVQQVRKIYNLNEKKAADLVKKTDKRRASYIAYYTDSRWGAAENYDICLDSGTLGEDGCVAVLKAAVENAVKRRKTRR